MATLEGSETQANVHLALAAETLARQRYRAYAERAEAEGNIRAAELFRTMADRRGAYALEHSRALGTPSKARGPASVTRAAIFEEPGGDYPGLARSAREAGLEDLALRFETMAKAGRVGAGRFRSVSGMIM